MQDGSNKRRAAGSTMPPGRAQGAGRDREHPVRQGTQASFDRARRAYGGPAGRSGIFAPRDRRHARL